MSHSSDVLDGLIKPLHTGFGFFAETILEKSQTSPYVDEVTESQSPVVLQESRSISLSLSEKAPIHTLDMPLQAHDHAEYLAKEKKIESSEKANSSLEVDSNYFVHPFFSFLAWTVDALVGFCFLVISLCINTVFIPKGFFDVTSSLVKYFSVASTDLGVLYTFLFSLQVWFFMAILVFLFQYSILGFEGSTLGRWLFGISIQNNQNKKLKVAERTKFCAALSEALLLGSILSFVFIILLPSRVPIFFWMRYSSKNL